MKKTSVLLIIISVTSYAAEQESFNSLPQDVLAKIISHAYVRYDHPKEFTNSACVAKSWHAVIKNPFFMTICKERGYVRPELVFFALEGLSGNIADEDNQEILKEKNEDILSTKLLSYDDLVAQGKESYRYVELADVNKKVCFQYIHPNFVRYDIREKGVFYNPPLSPFDHPEFSPVAVAIWVNPMRVVVYNGYFADEGRCDREKFYQSQMTLAHYMRQVKRKFDLEKQKLVEEKRLLYVEVDMITAEPKSFRGTEDYSELMYDPFILFDSPVLPERLVTKWPKEYNFKAFDGTAIEYSQAAYGIPADKTGEPTVDVHIAINDENKTVDDNTVDDEE